MTNVNQPGDDPTTRETARAAEPDAHGQAALLLAESTLHLLVEAGALTRDHAIEATRVAASVKRERAAETHESEKRMDESLALLSRIEHSLARIGDG